MTEAYMLYVCRCGIFFFFFSSRRRHTRCSRDWSSDVCSSDLNPGLERLLDMAFEANRSGEIRRKLELRLHRAVGTEERLENYPERLAEAGGGVLHLRRQRFLAASPGHAGLPGGGAAEENPPGQT